MSDGDCYEPLKFSVFRHAAWCVIVWFEQIMLLIRHRKSHLFVCDLYFDFIDSSQHLLFGRDQQSTIFPRSYCERWRDVECVEELLPKAFWPLFLSSTQAESTFMCARHGESIVLQKIIQFFFVKLYRHAKNIKIKYHSLWLTYIVEFHKHKAWLGE